MVYWRQSLTWVLNSKLALSRQNKGEYFQQSNNRFKNQFSPETISLSMIKRCGMKEERYHFDKMIESGPPLLAKLEILVTSQQLCP